MKNPKPNMDPGKRKQMISAYNLSVGYNDGNSNNVVQKSLRLKMFTGELVCLLGPNGAGKSTLLRTLCGLQQPLAGSVRLAGIPLDEYSPQKRSTVVSAVLTDKVSVEHMKVFDLVSMGRYPYTGFFGRCSVLDREIVQEAIHMVGIDDLSDRFIDRLSDGERQKVMIARALAQETPLIVLDEPMAFLDFPSKLELMQILRKLATEHNKGILMTTHDLSLSIQSADWIWLIGQDQKIRRGVPEDLVLKGDFADFYQKDNVSFDVHSGEFRIAPGTSKKISVRGNGLHAAWVRKALIRKGFKIVNARKGQEQIFVGDEKDFEVLIRMDKKEYKVNSIKDLLLKVQEL